MLDEHRLKKEVVRLIKESSEDHCGGVLEDIIGLSHLSPREFYKMAKEFVESDLNLLDDVTGFEEYRLMVNEALVAAAVYAVACSVVCIGKIDTDRCPPMTEGE